MTNPEFPNGYKTVINGDIRTIMIGNISETKEMYRNSGCSIRNLSE